MLGNLFGSNTRVKILKLFLLHPGERYYIRQISRDLKLQLNSVRRELENLEKFGLLFSESSTAEDKEEKEKLDSILAQKKPIKKEKKQKIENKQDRKYYQVNKNFVLFEEIKSLIVKAQILYEREFIEKLQKIGSPKLLILSGFFVNLEDAPVDLFVVGRINRVRFQKLIKDLEKELGKEVNYTVMDSAEFSYRKNITDMFLYGILENKKIVVIDEFKLFV